MSREILVLGAGMVGVSVAWHLQQRGHQVTLVDRNTPGRETSFGNAGLIQREAVRPYAFPRDLKTLLRVLPNRDIDIRYQMGGLFKFAGPLLRYWNQSTPSRYARIVPEYAALIEQSLDTHAEMIRAAKAESLMSQDGYIEVFRSSRALAAGQQMADEVQTHFGVTHQTLDAAALARMEPGLTRDLVGGIHWTQPWNASSPGGLVAAYALAFQQAGGQWLQAELHSLEPHQSGWQACAGQDRIQAEQVVVALGPWSTDWLKKLDIALPLFVKRGYHMHYANAEQTPLKHWLLDSEVGYVLAPMQTGIRLTSGAELATLDAKRRYQQLEAAENAARRFFPLGERLDAEPWMGGRPCMPDMKPVIGPSHKHPGLWLAVGHGHQGFTLGPATGKLLGQMMDGETPDIDMHPYRVERF
ncbi:NAD(P)/FAD-dependent oxidoreductase [Marinobacterium marinum]|uniref:FAD-binding oxidoreductase n=1 Tax=Marinobacterium marinum TaxID=2756129 RepID=A0A7W1WZU7_9GAMM|nr:FAD-binding oxidoreductase [Marinobacterium marinum]MBA4503274.1 FAD-binding oxidoreductase [Marinobacterium marinum]